MASRRSGFTLLELVLVLALIILLAAMVVPNMESMYADVKVDAAADHLCSCFAMARARAIEEGRVYRFAVQPGSSQYRLAPDEPNYWGGDNGSTPAPVTDDSIPALVLEDQLPGGVPFNLDSSFAPTVAATPDTGSFVTIQLFYPKGSCSDDRPITLGLPGSHHNVTVNIRALTGTVSIRPDSTGDAK